MLTAETRDADEPEDGFTLIEVIITVSISLLIVGAVTAAVITSLRLMEQGSSRLGDAGNNRFTSAYFSTDVHDSASFDTTPPTECGTGPLLIQFHGADFDAELEPRTTIVSYTLETISAPNIADTYQLHRQSCIAAGAEPGPLPLDPELDIVVASNLSTTIPPRLQCYGRGSNANVFAAENRVPTCDSAQASLLVLELTPESDASPFQLIGSRRSQ